MKKQFFQKKKLDFLIKKSGFFEKKYWSFFY